MYIHETLLAFCAGEGGPLSSLACTGAFWSALTADILGVSTCCFLGGHPLLIRLSTGCLLPLLLGLVPRGRPYFLCFPPDQVTCATTSLGLASARTLLLRGFRVVMQDSDVDALNDAVASLGDLARRDACYPICFDASSDSSVKAATLRITQDAWPVYILVLGGGPVSSGGVVDTDLEAWKDSFATHVEPAFLLVRALLPAMRKRRWGRIITTCSLAGKTGGVSAGVAYSTAKGALQTLTFALARETAKDGITVNGIAPAYANSGGAVGGPAAIARLLEVIPVGRFLEPEEVAHTVLFLCHPLSSFITGQIIGTFDVGINDTPCGWWGVYTKAE